MGTVFVTEEASAHVDFVLASAISHVETIAVGRGIRELARLEETYGRGRWRKLKGIAGVRLPDGTTRKAELHWYEATGIGRRETKITRYIET